MLGLREVVQAERCSAQSRTPEARFNCEKVHIFSTVNEGHMFQARNACCVPIDMSVFLQSLHELLRHLQLRVTVVDMNLRKSVPLQACVLSMIILPLNYASRRD